MLSGNGEIQLDVCCLFLHKVKELRMGARLSLHNHTPIFDELSDASHSVTCKRQRASTSFWDENPRLIPSLPDEISIQILARLPRIWHFNAKLVSRGWRAALMDRELYNMRKAVGITEEWLYIMTKLDRDKLVWHALDPVNSVWHQLPPMPNIFIDDGPRRGFSRLKWWHMVGPSIADTIRSWTGRKDALDNIPYCGCSVGTVDGCLYVVGGFCRTSALKSVWCYNPVTNAWSEVAPMSIGRAYCKIGVLNNKLYVVGGVTWGQGGLTPLQSAEVFDPSFGVWTELPSMPFSRAQVLPVGFLAELLKPIATGLTSYRGKLYIPQSLYCWPFFVDVGGEVYNPETNLWDEMPVGMGESWPAKQAGTKLSVIVDGDLYALDPSGSLGSPRIKVYDHEEDAWKTIEGDVPIRGITDTDSPYLLASFLGKLHVITKDGNNNILVMQADRQNQLDSAPSASSAAAGESLQENFENASAPAGYIWRVITSTNVGSAELVSCQNLKI